MNAIFDTERENQWCPGCGNFGILAAMKQAFENQGLRPEDILMVGGIGQAGKTPHYINANMLHGLHGRALAMATGAKTADHTLNVVVSTGDGDCYGEGGNHFLAAIRRNVDLTVLVHNNRVYGLTKGQASPTTGLGVATKLQPGGTTSGPVNPMAVALAAGASFVAQSFSGSRDQLAALIEAAMKHKGFALVDIFQPCVSFNKINTHAWYTDRIYDLAGTGHDTGDLSAAMAVALGSASDDIPTGIIYQARVPAFHERLPALREKALKDYPFAKETINDILASA